MFSRKEEGRPDWSTSLDRFIKGINFKGVLKEAHQNILKQYEGVVEIFEDSDETEDQEDFFFLN